MTVNDLNNSNELFLEKTMDELANAFSIAKDELQVDITTRIVLNELKESMKNWIKFKENNTLSKVRITIIEEKSKLMLKNLQRRINLLKQVKKIDKTDIEPLQEFLDELKMDVEIYVEGLTKKYRKLAHKK